MTEPMELYIHIPFCVRKCSYCDFLSAPMSPEEQRRYTDALCAEILWWGAKLCKEGEKQHVRTIFVGGGTPSWLDYPLMGEIFEAVREAFLLEEDCEITLEMNPGTVTEEALDAYFGMGINRISIGLQSVNDDELEELGRIHDYSGFLRTYEAVRRAGFRNVSVDVMTGLPHQTIPKLRNTLSSVTRLRPEHISCYSLIVEEGTPFYDKYEADVKRRAAGEPTVDLPDDETEYELYDYARSFLIGRGYLQYEISNYAREGYACRHNAGYWQRAPYLGVGIGAASLLHSHEPETEKTGAVNSRKTYLGIHYADLRFSVTRDFTAYCNTWCDGNVPEPDGEALTELTLAGMPWIDRDTISHLSIQEAMEEFMFLGLRMNRGVGRHDFFAAFGRTIDQIYADVIRSQISRGFLTEDAGRLSLTKLGADVSNEVLAEYLLT